VRVVLSNQAEVDLEEIGDYIAADNPVRAVSFVREVRDHFQQIAKAPLAYTGGQSWVTASDLVRMATT